MKPNNVKILQIGDLGHGWLPHVVDPINIDAWPSQKATKVFDSTIAEIAKRGYRGVVLQANDLGNGSSLISIYFDEQTPEGRAVPALIQLAQRGVYVQVAQVMSIIEKTYRLNGLEIPSKTENL